MPSRSTLVLLVGDNELIMDRDNITFGSQVTRWQKDPDNKDAQAPGDDRAPAWGWLGKLHYADTAEQWVGIPQDMLSACLRGAATGIPHPSAKGRKTLKEVSQAGIIFRRTLFPLLVQAADTQAWGPISFADLYLKLGHEENFDVHEAVAKTYGLRLDVRRAKPQYNRSHVRVRPMFGPWRCFVEATIVDEVLAPKVMATLWHQAGYYKGLGNWRPSVSKAGSYGTFSVQEGVPKEMQQVARRLGFTGA